MPTIEPSGWSAASVRLRPGDCKLDDARRLVLLSSGEWGPASRNRSFPRGTDETSRRLEPLARPTQARARRRSRISGLTEDARSRAAVRKATRGLAALIWQRVRRPGVPVPPGR